MDLSPRWRGHFLLFDPKEWPALPAKAAPRLLLAFVVLEGLLGPRPQPAFFATALAWASTSTAFIMSAATGGGGL